MLDTYFSERKIPMLQIGPQATTPLRFSASVNEHLATRQAGGLFDFSFMGCFQVSGPDGLSYLHRVQTRNVRLLQPNRLVYTLLCNPNGSVFIDATLWNHGDGVYWLFTGRRGDIARLLNDAAGLDVVITDLSGRFSVLALQGPASAAVLSGCGYQELADLRYFGFVQSTLFDQPCWVARLGFSGEFGYEIIVPVAAGRLVWENLCHAGRSLGLCECGFEAANSLRIESGYILFTNELSLTVTPFELRLERLVSFGHHEFIGSQALRRRRWQDPLRVLVGVELRDSVRRGQATLHLTSSSWSPIFRRRLGLGFAFWSQSHPGTLVTTQNGEIGRITRLPFYDSMRTLPRGSQPLSSV